MGKKKKKKKKNRQKKKSDITYRENHAQDQCHPYEKKELGRNTIIERVERRGFYVLIFLKKQNCKGEEVYFVMLRR